MENCNYALTFNRQEETRRCNMQKVHLILKIRFRNSRIYHFKERKGKNKNAKVLFLA